MIIYQLILVMAMMIISDIFQWHAHDYTNVYLVHFTTINIDDFSSSILKRFAIIFQDFFNIKWSNIFSEMNNSALSSHKKYAKIIVSTVRL